MKPKKCAFGVTFGKLLCYIIFTIGIEVDLEKVLAIMEMPSPRNIKQLRGLQDRLQSIFQFISQLADRAQPFNRNLHKGATTVWNEECQKSLDQIKEYLAKPPVLMPPI